MDPPILLNQFDPDTVFGSLDRTTQNADSEGITLQAVDKARLFGHRNQFTIGTSYDHGRVGYTANSELGTFEPKFVVAGTGLILSGSDDFNPRVLTYDQRLLWRILYRHVRNYRSARVDCGWSL